MSLHRPLLLLCLLLAALAAPSAVAAQAPDPNADTEEAWLEGYIPDDLPDDDIIGRDPSTYDDDLDEDGEDDPDEADGAARRGTRAAPTTRRTTVPGRRAMLRPDGTAAIPSGAPARVRSLIRAVNAIVGKPVKRGGGHARLRDSGYDAAGAVGYALVKVKAQRKVVSLAGLRRLHRGRAGRYVTIYLSSRHVYLEVAGLRLDTSTFGDASGRSGVRWRPAVGKRAGFGVRHPTGL